jgi:peptide/nickel transport system ATP-binding protein
MTQIQKNEKISFIYITHDLATAKHFADRIIILYQGKIVEAGDINDVLSKPEHPYTKALIQAVSEPNPENLYKEKEISWK